jgi:acetyl esterase/lipase
MPGGAAGVRLTRRLVAGFLALFGPPVTGTETHRVDVPRPGGLSVRGEWVRGPGAGRRDAVLLYLHGSGYAVCSARTHRGLTSRLSGMAGLPVFACDYRLAPHHRFPAAGDDVRAAYDWLLEQGWPAERIVLAGDSAGGHLAVDLVLELARAGRPTPPGMALFSPLIDLTFALARQRERVRRDPLVSAARARRLLALYTRGADAADPRLAFDFTGVGALPPTMIQAGAAEMLAADAEYLARCLRAEGGRCELQVWPDQMHVFQALPVLVPEAEIALGRAAAFLTAELALAGAAPLADREVV